uniref:Putative secreted protein n=1 Tax=Amblyomma cajennense TaxID=34607 RepID=A0A023FDI7_AMBCJ
MTGCRLVFLLIIVSCPVLSLCFTFACVVVPSFLRTVYVEPNTHMQRSRLHCSVCVVLKVCCLYLTLECASGERKLLGRVFCTSK